MVVLEFIEQFTDLLTLLELIFVKKNHENLLDYVNFWKKIL